MIYWDGLEQQQYDKMIMRHIATWKFVLQFCAKHCTMSILEIGCGMKSPLRYFPEYHGIDLNENTDAIHRDFVTMSAATLKGKDLLVAANVIEHHPKGWQPFLEKVLEVGPRYAIVTFFNRLKRPQDHLRIDAQGINRNRYAGRKIRSWLRRKQVKHSFHVLTKRDTILVIGE